MKHSTKAWEMVAPIYGAITQHPFNQELMKGTLSPENFHYYLEQNTLFVKNLSNCFALIASKIQPEYVGTFLKFAELSAEAARNFSNMYSIQPEFLESNENLSRVTQNFVSYLLGVSATEPVEIAVAAILPCFWIYRECALMVAQGSVPNNPYAAWIAQISSKEFGEQVNEAIHIFDALAEKTTDENRQKMLEAFSKCTMLEWHLWSDVFQATVYDASAVQ